MLSSSAMSANMVSKFDLSLAKLACVHLIVFQNLATVASDHELQCRQHKCAAQLCDANTVGIEMGLACKPHTRIPHVVFNIVTLCKLLRTIAMDHALMCKPSAYSFQLCYVNQHLAGVYAAHL